MNFDFFHKKKEERIKHKFGNITTYTAKLWWNIIGFKNLKYTEN